MFFRLKQGKFVAFADGKDRRVQLKLQQIERVKPKLNIRFSEEELKFNYERIYRDVEMILNKN